MTDPPGAASPIRRRLRRAAVALVVAAQLTLVVAGYWAARPVFGFQMFPETSTWRAEIVRVTDAGPVDVRDPWPGGYRWGALVEGRGLGDPFADHPADAGIDATLDLLDAALDWVAANTPDDTETRYLEARVTFVRNGRGPFETVLRSTVREPPE